jgi:hypothetical protein
LLTLHERFFRSGSLDCPEEGSFVEQAFEMLRILWVALVAAILLSGTLSFYTPGFSAAARPAPDPRLFRALVVVAVAEVGFLVYFWRKLVVTSRLALAANPRDTAALARWRTGQIISWALSLGIALYGLILRYVGFRFSDIAAFFIAGLILLFALVPRRPPQG